MRAVEFETDLIDNTITIPQSFQGELSLSKNNHVRVIVMIDDFDQGEEIELKKMLHEQFLKGYDDADAAYDNL